MASPFTRPAALAALAASLWWAPAPARATELAPYFQSWGGESLVRSRRAGMLDSAVLAFAVTQGRCALDHRFLRKVDEARTFTDEGGRLTLSMGGAEGIYAEASCTDQQLVDLIEALLRDTGTTRLDWDLEGRHLADAQANARRTRVLAALQARHPDLHTTFTLSGRLNGLSSESLQLLRSAMQARVRIDRVNVMTMTFGGRNVGQLSPATVAQAAITSFRAAAEQLAALYPDRGRAELHAGMGITPMIGRNDDDTVFTLHDAQVIAGFVREQRIGWLSYWSFQRDRAQAGDDWRPLGEFSGVAQPAGEFHRIFRGATGVEAEPRP